MIPESFFEELTKISVDLSGLKPETLLSYPKPEPMSTLGVEKALAILDRAEQMKTASVRGSSPDQLPQMKRFFRKKQGDEPPPGKVENALSYGGHTIAGAGAGKFLSGVAEKALQAKGKHFNKIDPRIELGMTAAGAALGLGNKLRKEHRKKQWQAGKAKTAAPFTFPRSGIASKQFLRRSGPSVKSILGSQLQGQKGQLPRLPNV